MRALLMFLLMSGSAFAQECRDGSPDVLSIEGWRLEKVDGPISGIDIFLQVRSHAPAEFRMIDASYVFTDALDRRISSFTFNPDLRIAPGKTTEHVSGYQGREMDRVLGMDRADVSVTTCTRAVVYMDGTKEEFN